VRNLLNYVDQSLNVLLMISNVVIIDE